MNKFSGVVLGAVCIACVGCTGAYPGFGPRYSQQMQMQQYPQQMQQVQQQLELNTPLMVYSKGKHTVVKNSVELAQLMRNADARISTFLFEDQYRNGFHNNVKAIMQGYGYTEVDAELGSANIVSASAKKKQQAKLYRQLFVKVSDVQYSQYQQYPQQYPQTVQRAQQYPQQQYPTQQQMQQRQQTGPGDLSGFTGLGMQLWNLLSR